MNSYEKEFLIEDFIQVLYNLDLHDMEEYEYVVYVRDEEKEFIEIQWWK